MRTDPPNRYRIRSAISAGPYASSDSHGMNGAFAIRLPGFGHKVMACCIVTDGNLPVGYEGAPPPAEALEWEHASVHIVEYGKERTPTWAEMSAIKDVFWREDEVVIQFHVAKADHINCHPHTLHLWRHKAGAFPLPPKFLV